MNYAQYFKDKQVWQSGDFRVIYCQDGVVELSHETTYPMLFVLKGHIEMEFGCNTLSIVAGQLVIIDREKLKSVVCDPQTVVLRYTPPEKLAKYFKYCCTTIYQPHTTPISILPELWDWIDRLVEELVSGKEIDNDTSCIYRRQLAAIIVNSYPAQLRGEIYMPFYACSFGSCEECRTHSNLLDVEELIQKQNSKPE